jgi:CHAT domain-containing protein
MARPKVAVFLLALLVGGVGAGEAAQRIRPGGAGRDSLIGLTRAFIYAGTPAVVATLWKVDDRATYELMREFYSSLRTTKKSAALGEAQLKIMKEFPAPFYWAAFILTGEP